MIWVTLIDWQSIHGLCCGDVDNSYKYWNLKPYKWINLQYTIYFTWSLHSHYLDNLWIKKLSNVVNLYLVDTSGLSKLCRCIFLTMFTNAILTIWRMCDFNLKINCHWISFLEFYTFFLMKNWYILFTMSLTFAWKNEREKVW